MIKQVEIWTDGSALNNGKPNACCGAGILLKFGSVMKELSIPLPDSNTNNQAELLAAIIGLETLTEPCSVTLYTDSSYVQQGITSWISGWKSRGWKTANKGAVKNVELWQRLDVQNNKHSVLFKWVKGHADNEYNITVDRLAVEASTKLKIERGL